VAFNKHRAHIESVASDKYDRGEIERDGRTILVSAADIETHLSDARNHGERTGELPGPGNVTEASALKRPWFD
jgi:hypothetical protein